MLLRKKNVSLLIFDLDDTLVDTSDVYWRAKKLFIEILKKQAPQLAESFLDKTFEDIDTLNLKGYGHAPTRYGKSMIDTYLFLLSKKYLEYDLEIEKKIAEAGNMILNTIPKLINGAIDLLIWCKSKYNLALVTRGEEDLQRKKINHLKLEHYFDLIRIVPEKSESDFVRIIKDFHINKKDTWIIGDSLKAEIETGLKLGVNCIFFNYSHSSYRWIQERNYSIVSRKAFFKVNSLNEIPIILERSAFA